MTSYIWFYTYVHKEHGWSTTPARKPGSLPGPISKEGLGWGVLPSPPSQLPLKPPHCTFSTSISETPAPALRHRNPGWVKLAVQPFPPPPIFPPLQTQTQVLCACPSPARALLAGGLPSSDSPPLWTLSLPAASPGEAGPCRGASAFSGPGEPHRDAPLSRGGCSSLVSEATTLL